MHLSYAVCAFLSLGPIVLNSSAMMKANKTRRAAGLPMMIFLQHNRRPVVKARGGGAWSGTTQVRSVKGAQESTFGPVRFAH